MSVVRVLVKPSILSIVSSNPHKISHFCGFRVPKDQTLHLLFFSFQGLSAGVETFTVLYTVTQMSTVALTITKLTQLRRSEKRIL